MQPTATTVPRVALAVGTEVAPSIIGAVVTALLGLLVGDSAAGWILTILAAIGTAVAVYAVPNAPTDDVAGPPVYDPPPAEDEVEETPTE